MASGQDLAMTEEQRQARDRIHELLSELHELIGPKAMYACEDEEDILAEDEEVPDQVFLSEWVLVANWVGADEIGGSYVTMLGSENLITHHRKGLLHEALFDFEN